MARVDIPVQLITAHNLATITWTAADSTNDHSFKNTGKEILVIKSGATTATLTVVGQTDENRRSQNETLSITANGQFISNTFPPNLFNTGGVTQVNLDASTDIYLACVRVVS